MGWVTRVASVGRRQLAALVTRILLINLAVMAVPIAGFWFAQLYERQLLGALEDDMVHQAQVLRETLQVPEAPALGQREKMLARVTEHTGMRLRLIRADGLVASDSGGPALKVDARPEVRRALAGHYGSSTRFSPQRRRLNLFIALPITRDGEVVGAVYGSRSTASVTRSLMDLKRHLIRVFTFSLGITLVMTCFLAATISRPIARLARRADRIARGDTVVPLSHDSASELGELARAFERMRVRLQGRADEKAAMAADISHEFKSPLTGIRGAAELLLEGAAEDPEALRHFLQNIVDDSERMSRLVGRLLELSRVQADNTHPSLINLSELAERESDARCKVQLEVPPSPVFYRGRRPQLQSAIVNLLDNAEQHASPGTAVRARLWCDRQGLYFQVHNQGTAVSEARLAGMWQRFYTTRSEDGGSGLGLAIVKSAVEAHGGRVEARSEDFETRVGFFLPS
jgi:two-component system sensor histidine kinase ChvG